MNLEVNEPFLYYILLKHKPVWTKRLLPSTQSLMYPHAELRRLSFSESNDLPLKNPTYSSVSVTTIRVQRI